MKLFLIRYSFVSLFAFEFLNAIKVFHFPLHFPWLGLAATTFSGWIFWEKTFKKNFYFPTLTGGFLLFQLYSNSLGNLFRFYDKFYWYDKFTHLSGGAAAGSLVFLILRYLNKKRKWQLGFKSLLLFSISLALFICVIYEFSEYFFDAVLGYYVITGKYDTSCDLLLDLIGITIVIFVLNLFFKKELPHKSDKIT